MATNNELQPTQTAATPAKNTLPPAERFTQLVLSTMTQSMPEYMPTMYERQLIQGYFVKIDQTINTYEADRVRKNSNNRDHKFDNNLPCTWKSIDTVSLAQSLMHCARVGLDMRQSNHLFPVIYKDNKNNRYTINLTEGYNGIAYLAENYALHKPRQVITELVYSNDTFIPKKRSSSNPIEGYEFEIGNPFDRGEIVGAFGYIEHEDPNRNKLIMMTKKDIDKRKPEKASGEFWGNASKEGWYEEMALKTIKREVYSAKHIPRDPRKIDASYQAVLKEEQKTMAAIDDVDRLAGASANIIDINDEVVEAPQPQPEPMIEQAMIAEGPPEVETTFDDMSFEVDTETGEKLDFEPSFRPWISRS